MPKENSLNPFAISAVDAMMREAREADPSRDFFESLDPLLTVNQVASICSVTPTSVYEWIRRGVLVARKIGGVVRVLRGDLVKALRTIEPATIEEVVSADERDDEWKDLVRPTREAPKKISPADEEHGE